jgi:hypothetical protein
MKTSPVFGWPIADGPDPVKQFPAAVDEPRTLAIEAALTRAYASSVRESDAASGPNVFTPFAAEVAVPNAPDGLYLIAVTGLWKRNGVAGTPVQVQVTVGVATVWERYVGEVNDDFIRTTTLAAVVPYTGTGTLRVNAQVRGIQAPITALTGSRIDVARIGV